MRMLLGIGVGLELGLLFVYIVCFFNLIQTTSSLVGLDKIFKDLWVYLAIIAPAIICGKWCIKKAHRRLNAELSEGCLVGVLLTALVAGMVFLFALFFQPRIDYRINEQQMALVKDHQWKQVAAGELNPALQKNICRGVAFSMLALLISLGLLAEGETPVPKR
jgi:hypothetical protein